MHRSPRGYLTAGLVFAFALSATNLLAQDENRGDRGNQRNQRGQGGPGGFGGGPGGPGGGGFGGPGGGFGGPGGPGGFGGRGGNPGASMVMLIQSDAVQTEVKLTDPQKAQVKEVLAKADKKRSEMFQKMQADRNARRDAQATDNPDANGGNNRGNDNNNEARRAMFEQMNAAQQESETALGKILNANQKTRLKQLALQMEGPQAFVGETLIAKLTLEDEQVSAIREILGDLRNRQREMWRPARGDNNGGPGGDRGNNRGGNNGDRAANNANGGDRGNNARNRDNGNNNGDRGNNRGGDNNRGGNNGDRGNNRGGDNNGGPGGNGGNRPDFNSPEFQARMAQMNKDRTKLNDTAMVAIGKVLSPAQRSIYQKMTGPKFDLSKIEMRGPGGRGPGGPPATATAAATPAAVTPTAATAPADAPKPAARKSLSERRAGGSATPK